MGFLEERDLSAVPSVTEFYKGKTIFMTGGSGFMGKVLVEKLLYSCPDLDRIYLLLRSKKGVNPEDRLSQIYALPCFDRLRNERPNVFQSKVFVVSGDVMEFGLGISDEDRALLVNRVDIIFHVAASVRFDDTLKYAAKLNLRGTREVLELGKDTRNLSAFIHVSTSYSNTNRETIEEVIYPPHADWRETLEICEQLDDHTLRTLTPKYMGELPNTYTFTKQLAEHVVYEQRGKLPIVIVRPSIVISSMVEPVPGWIDNFNGPVGLLLAAGKGIMRSVYSDPSLIADYMPVDIAIKHIIATGWIRGTEKLEASDDIPIYNCCSGNIYKISMKEVVEIGRELATRIPLDGILWTVGGDITTSKTLHYIKVIFLHLLPAVFVDMILWIIGNKPMLVKLQRRIYIANLALQYYILKQWTFANTNVLKLRDSLKEEDQKDFSFESENVDVNQYFFDAFYGAKKYLLKEKKEDEAKAKTHAYRISILEKVVKFLFYAYILWRIMNTAFFQNVFEGVHDFVVGEF